MGGVRRGGRGGRDARSSRVASLVLRRRLDGVWGAVGGRSSPILRLGVFFREKKKLRAVGMGE